MGSNCKTLHQQNPPVLNWKCQLMQVDLCNGCKTGVVGFSIVYFIYQDHYIATEQAWHSNHSRVDTGDLWPLYK